MGQTAGPVFPWFGHESIVSDLSRCELRLGRGDQTLGLRRFLFWGWDRKEERKKKKKKKKKEEEEEEEEGSPGMIEETPVVTETVLLENAPSSMNAVVTGAMDDEDQSGNARLGYSGRSEKMHRFLAKEFKDTGAADLSYEEMCRNQTRGRRELIAGCFFELLVLKTNGVINLEQADPLSDIKIAKAGQFAKFREKAMFMGNELAPGCAPRGPQTGVKQPARRTQLPELALGVETCGVADSLELTYLGISSQPRCFKSPQTRLGQLCQLFQLASSPDNSVQQQVMQMLQQFSQLPDFNMYLATVFAKLTSQDEVVRQRAGLLLKTNVGRVPPGTLQPAVAEYVQAHALSAVRDSSKVIRHTAGTVISILVLKVGIVQSRPTLDQLAGCLGDPNADTVEGSFNALNKICEEPDGMMLIKQTWDYPDEQTQHFVSWSAENFLPKVMQPIPIFAALLSAIDLWKLSVPAAPALGARYIDKEILKVKGSDSDMKDAD
eukprot:s95_g3.t1